MELKIGDEIAIWGGGALTSNQNYSYAGKITKIGVHHITADGYYRLISVKKDQWTTDPEAVSMAKKRREEQVEKSKKREAEYKARKADPRLVLADRFSSGMENWENLTLEQLQQIEKWLETKKGEN